MAYEEEIEDTCVYWYHYPEHDDIGRQGYVGITNSPKKRHNQHLNQSRCLIIHRVLRKHGDKVLKDIVFEGTRDECLAKEIELRPDDGIGWNILKGGGDTPDCSNRVWKQSSLDKLSKSLKGKNLGRPCKFKGVTDRWTDEQKKKIGSHHIGKTISDEHRESISKKHAERISNGTDSIAKFITLVHKDNPDVELRFDSVTLACQNLGIIHSQLKSTCLRRNPNYTKSGYKVLYEKSHDYLGIKKDGTINIHIGKRKRKLVMVHEDNPDKEYRFNSIKEASEFTNIKRPTLNTYVQKNIKVFKFGWKIITS